MNRAFQPGLGIVLTLLPVLGLTGCREKNQFAAPPPPKVTVANPLHQTVVTYREFVGRTEPIASVEVRARVRGFLRSIEFEAGKPVEAGALLFTIESAEYEAAHQTAQAQKAEADAELQRTQTELERVENLIDQQAASETEHVEARAAFLRAKAAVLAAEAAVSRAALDLEYTQISAPISGRINRSKVDEGNLVGHTEPTLLTTIVQWDPMHVYFTVAERDVLEFRRRIVALGEEPEPPDVLLRLADGSDYPVTGRVDYADNRVDSQTGTVRVRAVFENPDGLLVPGIFTHAQVPYEARPYLLVPEAAIQRDLSGYFLLTADEQGVVERRNVEVGPQTADYRAITVGLTGDEQVIVRGLQRARPGTRVEVQKIELPPIEQPAVQHTVVGVATQPSGNAD